MTKGRIHTQYTVFCGTCGNWEYLNSEKSIIRKTLNKLAKECGYKLTKEKGWVCWECQGIPKPDPSQSIPEGWELKDIP